MDGLGEEKKTIVSLKEERDGYQKKVEVLDGRIGNKDDIKETSADLSYDKYRKRKKHVITSMEKDLKLSTEELVFLREDLILLQEDIVKKREISQVLHIKIRNLGEDMTRLQSSLSSSIRAYEDEGSKHAAFLIRLREEELAAQSYMAMAKKEKDDQDNG